MLFALSAMAAAQDYPNRPVRLVVPFPPGGINDIVGRVIAQHLGDRLGKQVIVENRGGAGGVVGSEFVANAPKDGHTLLIVSLASAVNPWLYTLPYDPVKSFAPVAMLVAAPNVVTVNPGLPVNSIKELVALAKAKPGELQYASSGVGTFLHLAGELFKITADVDILHIPFRGAGPALIDVVGGHTKVAFGSVTSSIAHIRAGKLRALGVGSMTRSPTLPDVPTVIEAGVPGYEAVELDRPRRDRRHARAHRGAAAQGDFRDSGFARGAEAVRLRRRRHRPYEHRAVRRLHDERDRQMGPRRQAGRHQGAVAFCCSARGRGRDRIKC